eukprot:scaffold60590_cov60-Phaeocystis_antarctica.AAC.1
MHRRGKASWGWAASKGTGTPGTVPGRRRARQYGFLYLIFVYKVYLKKKRAPRPEDSGHLDHMGSLTSDEETRGDSESVRKAYTRTRDTRQYRRQAHGYARMRARGGPFSRGPGEGSRAAAPGRQPRRAPRAARRV